MANIIQLPNTGLVQEMTAKITAEIELKTYYIEF